MFCHFVSDVISTVVYVIMNLSNYSPLTLFPLRLIYFWKYNFPKGKKQRETWKCIAFGNVSIKILGLEWVGGIYSPSLWGNIYCQLVAIGNFPYPIGC